MSGPHHVGQRLSYEGAVCTVRYIGEVAGTTGAWLGVEWDDQTRGKHDGSHKGVRYFTCVSRAPMAASFIRPARKADEPRSFIAALNDKYVSEADDDSRGPQSQIVFSGKVAEEVGFDKIRRKLARVEDIKIVTLDGMCIAVARGDAEKPIGETCPNITQLDLSRNLFEKLSPVVDICRELPKLRKLHINGNRFHDVLSDVSMEDGRSEAFGHVNELHLGDTLLDWSELCHIARGFPSLATLVAGSNQLSMLPPVEYSSLASTLTSIKLEFNEITTLADLGSLTALTALRDLHLKGNNITGIAPRDSFAPVFPSSVEYVDLSYNNIKEWSFVDRLPIHFPGLKALRLTHNPVYEAPSEGAKSSSTEDAHMFTIARISSLKSLNFTAISVSDRSNAEMFYLSRIAKQLASVPETAEDAIKSEHPRYAELCNIYGEPDVIRREEVNPSFLESRLVNVSFHLPGVEGKKTVRIPKSFDMYSIKGIAGKLFGLQPLELRLVWETGEWDPVAGVYDRDGDSSDEELDVEEAPLEQTEDGDSGSKPGRWVKREVELKDGPRQLGYCVDGLDATIRIEQQ